MNPRFSVVIPLYNKASHIQRALDSVLAQTLGDFELIVINDGSSDGGERVVGACSDPRVRLVNQQNQGVSAARNKGVVQASAPHVAFLDADDAWQPGFLAEIAPLIAASPDSALFATAYEMLSPDGKTRDYSAAAVGPALSSGVFLDYLDCVGRDTYPFYTSSACVNRAAFLDCGGFDRSLQIGEDVVMWLALSLRVPACFSPMVGATYHRDAENRAMNQSGRSEKILSYVRTLVATCGSAPLSTKQADDFKGLISFNLYRSCVGFMRSGETARAKQIMSEFDAFLLPRQRSKLLRKAFKYTLLGPFLRARRG